METLQIMLCGSSDVKNYIESFKKQVKDVFQAKPINFLEGTHDYDNNKNWIEDSLSSVKSSDIIIFLIVEKYGKITWETEYPLAFKEQIQRIFLILRETNNAYNDFKRGKTVNEDLNSEVDNKLFEQLKRIEEPEQTLVPFAKNEFEEVLNTQLIKLRDKAIKDKNKKIEQSQEQLNKYRDILLGERSFKDNGFEVEYFDTLSPVQKLQQQIEECYSINQSLMIFGETLSGKSRAIYEFLKTKEGKNVELFSSRKTDKFPDIIDINFSHDVRNIIVFDDFHSYLSYEDAENKQIITFFQKIIEKKQEGYDIWVIVAANQRKYCEEILNPYGLIDDFDENTFFCIYEFEPLTSNDKKELLLKLGESKLEGKFLDSTIGSYYYPFDARVSEFKRFSEEAKDILFAYFAISLWRKKNHGNISLIIDFLIKTQGIDSTNKEKYLNVLRKEILPKEYWINKDISIKDEKGDYLNIRLYDEIYKMLLKCLLQRKKSSEEEFIKKVSFQIVEYCLESKTYSQLIRLSQDKSIINALLDDYLLKVKEGLIEKDSFLYSKIFLTDFEKYNKIISNYDISLGYKDFNIYRVEIILAKGYINALEVFDSIPEDNSLTKTEFQKLYEILLFKAKNILIIYELYQRAKKMDIEIIVGPIFVAAIIHDYKFKKNEYGSLLDDILYSDLPKILDIVCKGAILDYYSFSIFWTAIINTLKNKKNTDEISREIFKYIQKYDKILFKDILYNAFFDVISSYEQCFNALITYIPAEIIKISNINKVLGKLLSHRKKPINNINDIIQNIKKIEKIISENPNLKKDLLYFLQVIDIHIKLFKSNERAWDYYTQNNEEIQSLINVFKQNPKQFAQKGEIFSNLIKSLIKCAPTYDDAFMMYGFIYKELKNGTIKVTPSFFNAIFHKIELENIAENHNFKAKKDILDEMKGVNLFPSKTTIHRFFFPYYGFSTFIILEPYIRKDGMTQKMPREIEAYFFKMLNNFFKKDASVFSNDVFEALKWLERHITYVDEEKTTLYSYFVQLSRKANAAWKKKIYCFMRDSFLLSNDLINDEKHIKTLINESYSYKFCKEIYNYQELKNKRLNLDETSKRKIRHNLKIFLDGIPKVDEERSMMEEVEWCLDRDIWVGIPILKDLSKKSIVIKNPNLQKFFFWLSKPQYLDFLKKESLAGSLGFKRKLNEQTICDWMKSNFSRPLLNRDRQSKYVLDEVEKFEIAIMKLCVQR